VLVFGALVIKKSRTPKPRSAGPTFFSFEKFVCVGLGACNREGSSPKILKCWLPFHLSEVVVC
jgi:hypothetical protein